MLTVEGLVRMVMLQFSFTNLDAVPPLIRCQDEETAEGRTERKEILNGVAIISPTEQCSLKAFAQEELLSRGYELVDAFYQERLDPRDREKRRKYHVVRFTFVHPDFARLSPESKAKQPALLSGLGQICDDAFWRVRAFSNPFFEGGQSVEGQRALSINLEARVPRFQGDGQPVTRWQKDAEGERVGTAPLPLQPKYELRVVDDTPTLVSTSVTCEV